jgi:hypothetical protein
LVFVLVESLQDPSFPQLYFSLGDFSVLSSVLALDQRCTSAEIFAAEFSPAGLSPCCHSVFLRPRHRFQQWKIFLPPLDFPPLKTSGFSLGDRTRSRARTQIVTAGVLVLSSVQIFVFAGLIHAGCQLLLSVLFFTGSNA